MKSIIVITTPNGKDQYYREQENSVMHVGKMLESFVVSAGFMGNIAEDNHLAYLLGMEKTQLLNGLERFTAALIISGMLK